MPYRVEFDGGAAYRLNFQAPRFKYDLTKNEENDYWKINFPNYVKFDMRLPDPTIPKRTFSLLVVGMEESETLDDYFTY